MVDNGILWINPYPVDNTIFIDFPNTQPVDIEDITWPPTNELPNHFALIVFWCERRDVLCSHSNGDIFTCEDNMLFSHVKISSFRPKAHLAFHWCFYNTVIYLVDGSIPRLNNWGQYGNADCTIRHN